MSFTFKKLPVPSNAPAGTMNIGTWNGKPLVLIGKELYELHAGPTNKYVKLDGYDVGAVIYTNLREQFNWSHSDAAEALKISQRTAEGMTIGRVSIRNRKAICQLAATVNA